MGRLGHLHERDEILDQLLSFLQDPTGKCAALLGETGLGKPAIVNEFARRLASDLYLPDKRIRLLEYEIGPMWPVMMLGILQPTVIKGLAEEALKAREKGLDIVLVICEWSGMAIECQPTELQTQTMNVVDGANTAAHPNLSTSPSSRIPSKCFSSLRELNSSSVSALICLLQSAFCISMCRSRMRYRYPRYFRLRSSGEPKSTEF